MVAEMIALGFTFQGKIIRPAVVWVEGEAFDAKMDAALQSPAADDQSQLPLGATPA